jgi:NAD(P)-dependent dehydrogenase (short-subunit alcohol dehydrogenase family)
LITGANSGIGKATTLGLAEKDAQVIMVCRNKDTGETARREIVEQTGNDSVDLLIADLSSRDAIKQLVKEFKLNYQKLHVLINNAGAFFKKRHETIDGFETTFAVNHLAPFMLTNLLLDILKRSAPARVINVSSTIHKNARINFDDLQAEKKYTSFKAYGQSKLAMILFTNELSRRLEGTYVTVNALHPGSVKSNIGRDFGKAMKIFSKLSKSPEKGAETSLYLATSPEIEGITGKYFVNKKEEKSSKQSHDIEIAQKLWDISVKLTKFE